MLTYIANVSHNPDNSTLKGSHRSHFLSSFPLPFWGETRLLHVQHTAGPQSCLESPCSVSRLWELFFILQSWNFVPLTSISSLLSPHSLATVQSAWQQILQRGDPRRFLSLPGLLHLAHYLLSLSVLSQIQALFLLNGWIISSWSYLLLHTARSRGFCYWITCSGHAGCLLCLDRCDVRE